MDPANVMDKFMNAIEKEKIVFVIKNVIKINCGLLGVLLMFVFSLNGMVFQGFSNSNDNPFSSVDPIGRIISPDEKTVFMKLSDTRFIRGFYEGVMKSLYGEIYPGKVYFFETTNETPVIIDCGSNIGMSVIYFKELYPQASVYAFEPDHDSFSMLQYNVAVNKLTNVSLFNVALDEKEGETFFYYDAEKPGNPCMTLTSGMFKDKQRVKVEKLSDHIKQLTTRIDLVKIDVEGAEHGILRDLVESKTINLVNKMLIEYHHHMGGSTEDKLGDFLKMLENNGFGYQLGIWDDRGYESTAGGQSFMIHAYRKTQIGRYFSLEVRNDHGNYWQKFCSLVGKCKTLFC